MKSNSFRTYMLPILFQLVGLGACLAQSFNYYDDTKNKIEFPKSFDEKKSKELITTIAIAKQNYHRDGKIVTIKEWDNYLNNVAQKLLQNDNNLAQKIKIYCVKDLSINAISFIDGSIYINQGLIIHLKSEAELAFILAHEIAHINKQHTLKEIDLQIKARRAEINSDNNIGQEYRTLIHSKENEYEADALALRMVIQAGYKPYEAILSLNLLKSDTSLFPRVNIAELLANEVGNSTALLDSNEWKNNKNKTLLLKIESSSSDQFSTHPDIDKRIFSLNEQLRVYDRLENLTAYKIIDSPSFNNLIMQFRLMTLTTSMEDFEYQAAIILVLSNKFNFNRDLVKITLLKSLYNIAQAKENKYEDELLNKYSLPIDSNALELHKILIQYDNNKLKKLVYGFSKKLVENKESDDFYFYYGLCNEMYLGKQTSQIIFQNLLNKFPNSRYELVVKNKLSSYESK